jgi:hypothetical protein
MVRRQRLRAILGRIADRLRPDLPPGEDTEPLADVAAHFLSLRTPDARRLADEISAVVERMHRMGRDGDDAISDAWSMIPWAPPESADDDREARARSLDNADLRFFTFALLSLHFPHDVVRRMIEGAEPDPEPEFD